MAPRISLALAIHNHQPVGNFGWVIEKIHDDAYLPMVQAIERHPAIRLALHYSGPLLEWLRLERPAFLVRLRALVDRGQVELLGGGYFEPVLASLPERDRLGQLRRMAEELEGLTGRRPSGAWLAERVWEPDVPTSLAGAGYRYTILDDVHFVAASIPAENRWGAYTTDDQGSPLTVFGTEQGLRLAIPFGEVEEVIAYLRRHATEDGERLGMMGDDGEKFGAWPTTHEHCWGTGRWVERFFEALEENAAWLSTVTPTEWLESHPPAGRIYVPTSSYSEMGEWALPPDESIAFAETLARARAEGRPAARWLRGGFWRNFQVLYREINDLHKQMLRASDKVAAMGVGVERDRALDHLYQGQSNDCYWHGLFGGIYISHMRAATYEHLIAAEDIADTAAGSVAVGDLRDLDLDGVEEALLAGPGQVVSIKLSEGAGIGAWDLRAARHALTAVMRRRPEAYHSKLDAAPKDTPAAPAAASIHDIVAAKEEGLAAMLVYDSHERRSGLVHIFATGTTPAEYARAEADELGDFVDRPFEVVELSADRLVVGRDGWLTAEVTGIAATEDERWPVRVEKTLKLAGGRLDPSLSLDVVVENRSTSEIDALLGVAWDLTMLGGGGNPAAWWELAGRRTPHDGTGAVPSTRELRSGNDHLGISLTTVAEPAASAWWSPIESISNSEAGFERVYQGSALLLVWPLRLEPGGRGAVRVVQSVEVQVDRAAEEAAAEAG